MKRILALLLVLAVTAGAAGCAQVRPESPSLQPVTTQQGDNATVLGYRPIEPLPVDEVTYFDKKEGRIVRKNWGALTHNQTMALLPNQTAEVSVRKESYGGKLSYMPASISGEAGSYAVTLDYMKYRVEELLDDKQYLGDGRVGIGLRIKATVKTTKANLNLGGLLGLGLEASLNNLSGSISVNVMGMDAASITDLLPITATIDQTSIQNTLQALAAVKAKMWEPNTTITPQLLSVVQAKAEAVETVQTKGVGTLLRVKPGSQQTSQDTKSQETGPGRKTIVPAQKNAPRM